MSEDKPRTSRFRRGSRFRKPKAPPRLSKIEESPGKPPGKLEKKKKEEPPPPPPEPVTVTNVLTINVKEWFQTAAASEVIKFSHWSKYERRIERGLHLILGLLQKHNVKATFFVLGIVAREFPELVKLIVKEGHEVGTMGYFNRRIHDIPPKEYINELEMSLTLLKSLTNKDVELHRAPEWSITTHTTWVFEVLKTYGIKYDSSIYPVKTSFYGIEKAPRVPYIINPMKIIEFPPTTYRFAGKNLAMFGGPYLRILPYSLISLAFNSINQDETPVMVHVSPWEIDAEFPKLNLSWEGYFQQYAGIKSTFSKLMKLLKEFKFETLSRVLEENPPTESYHVSSIGKEKKSVLPEVDPGGNIS